MYLKRLEMHGFKSFAKKADLTFNHKITIVVGPNGSGKSNIVDAVRWVLGEGSAKSLRGSKMEDVIFSGSIEKKPLGMAQVSLTLDNSTGIFPIDYSEIKVTRKLYRSGESEYLINNNRCRLKDIHELIMDTGIGRDSFAIIGQGKVDQILLSQAEEKRMLIEEVAGVSKYRYRKNEAKRKLADTEQSLCRVRDIIAELSSQEEPLRLQSEKAKCFKSFKEELDSLEIKTFEYMISTLQEKADQKSTELESLRQKLLALDTEVRKEEAENEETAVLTERITTEISDLQSNIYGCENQINDHQNKLDLSRKMLETLEASQQKTDKEYARVLSEKQLLEEKEKTEALHYQKTREEYEAALADLRKEELKINSIKNSENTAEDTIAAIKEQIFDHVHQISDKKNTIIDADKKQAILEAGLSSTEKKIQQYHEKSKALFDEKSKISEQNQALKEAISELSLQTSSIGQEIEQLAAQYKGYDEQNNDLQRQKSKALANKTALESLQDNLEGYHAGVKNVFKNKRLTGILGTVADVVSVTGEYVLAIETALGGSIQHIVTEDDQSAKAGIHYLRDQKMGRATFLPLTVIKSRLKKQVAPPIASLKNASDLVSYDQKYEPIIRYLLGHIYVAEDIEKATAINKKLDKPVRIITLQGEVLDPRGAMTGGIFKNQQNGLLQRKEQIRTFEETITALDQQIDIMIKETKVTEQKISEKETEKEKYFQSIKQQEERLRVLENQLSQIDFQHQETEAEVQHLDKELASAKEDMMTCTELKEKLQQELMVFEKAKADLESELLLRQEQAEQEKTNLYDLEKQLSRKEIVFNDLKNKKENAKYQYDMLLSKSNETQEKKKTLEAEQKELSEKSEAYKEDSLLYKKTLKECAVTLHQLKENYDEKKEEKERLEQTRKSREIAVKEKRKETETHKEKIHAEELQIEKYKTEIKGYIESLQDRFHMTYQSKILDVFEDFSERKAKQRIRELKREIEHLGDVNVLAIAEYQKLMERYTFLKEQSEDLEKAQESLSQIISEMDVIIARKFKETFSKINEAFKETFREMFNGGSAEIVMTDKDNVLETGVEIIAQPPGKTPKHLNLLSGGEKAMTAICLLFAILKTKPGPFCILDEIEASLDESNVVRFSKFLKKFSELTQFIVISHRKGTMEAADVLYGVTMEEKGVSNLISVRISENIKLSG